GLIHKRPTHVGRSHCQSALLSCLPPDCASHFGTRVLVHVHLVRFPSVLLDISQDLIFTFSACLPIAVSLTNVCTAEGKVLVALACVALRRRTFRHILWHSIFLHRNCCANPEQRRENRELLWEEKPRGEHGGHKGK